MPVGANRPGKHWGLGGTKPSKEKVDDRSADSKDPEVPAKPAAKPIATDASQKSQAGLTAEEHFHELRIKVRQAGGPDLKTVGWTCTLVVSPKLEGAAADSATALDPCWTEPDGKQYLYHANNNAKLTKTTLDGSVVWQVNGFFGQNTTEYRPTWFATPPDSKYTYLCDGYGSNNVYVFDRADGTYTNVSYGGKGGRDCQF